MNIFNFENTKKSKKKDERQMERYLQSIKAIDCKQCPRQRTPIITKPAAP